MKRKTNIILIIIIAVLIMMSLPGAAQRLKNEKNNDAIILAADHASFKIVTDKIKVDVFDQLDELREYGLNTVLISNKTIRNYESQGIVSIYYVYEIINLARSRDIDIDYEEYFKNSLFILPDAQWYEHIKNKLDNRFAPGTVIETEFDGRRALVLNAELDERTGVNMGFDEQVIKTAIDNGFQVALSMQNENFGNTEFLTELEYIFNTYEISYVEINSFAFPGYPDALAKAVDIINASGVPLMLKADFGKVNPNQTSGLYDYLYESDFNAARTFYIRDYIPYSNIVTPTDYYYRMLRAAVDRGNRILVISPITHPRRIFSQMSDDTKTMLRLFYSRLEGVYDFGKSVPGTDFDEIPYMYSYFSALSIIFASLLILINVFDKKRIFYVLYILFILVYIIFAFMFQRYLGRLNALLGTLIFPSLFAVFLGLEISKNDAEPLRSALRILPAFFITAAAGAATAVVNLSTAQSFLGITPFIGVKLTFVIPVVMFFVVLILINQRPGELIKKTVEISKRPVTYFALVLLGVGAFAAYVYLIRSGNDPAGLVASFEIRTREFFENLLLTRPRTKEFLFGYPSIALLIYFSGRDLPVYLKFIFGVGAMTGLISLVNTFCHVTAYVNISIQRSIYGIVVGFFISASLIILIYISEVYIKKYKKRYSNG